MKGRWKIKILYWENCEHVWRTSAKMLSAVKKPCPFGDIIPYNCQPVLAGSGAAAGTLCESQAGCGRGTQWA